MEAIVESEKVRVVRTRYGVPGWGTGELWTAESLVLAHEFDFAALAGDGAAPQGRVLDDEAAELISRVQDYLAGEAVSFGDVPLDLDWCTDFQRAVLDVLRALPRGEIASYGEIAALAGYPGAGRAVGTVCAQNRFSLFVPCHRVVSATGIGGYGSAGLDLKRRLLALEGVTL